ncbi:FimD/PapC N-terminal domain-containing protein, partial [Pseudomonas syringae pv. tagetis]|uniref:FimD/PapC N-terminal domain-containing protein n=1 Tax=Pseudomonas syringae group genomosp. 7 TaxID=251699 RepID=UPI00377026E0
APAQACFDLPARIEFSRFVYQAGALRLPICVPQAFMSRCTRGYVSPELWDHGETPGFINYNAIASRRRNKDLHADQYY